MEEKFIRERRSQRREEHTAQQAAYTELCRHLEHAPDEQLLSDHTAVLLFGLEPTQREAALQMLRGQLYSRQMRDTGRVESWFTDCGARLQEDRAGFLEHAQQEYLRAGLAEEARRNESARAAKQRGRLRVRPASDFAPEQAEYLMEPYLPRGMISILGGVSGVGKTSLALDLCARMSRKARREGKGPIVYLTAENDPNKVLRPRAEAMKADLAHLYFQEGAGYSMTDEGLFRMCRTLHPTLLVFDPIQSYLGPGVQMNRAEQVRPLLDGLGALAKELDMAVLLISHMSKPGPGVCSALDRLLGSSDFRNAARSILIVGRDPEHPDTRVFAHAKNSLGVPGKSQRYHICADGTVAYDGPCELTADCIIRDTGEGQPRTRPAAALGTAVEVLERQLGFTGWVEHAEVERLCARHGFSERTMQRARDALELRVIRTGKPPEQKCLWHRAELDRDAVLADYRSQNKPLNMADLEKTSTAKPVSSYRT